jgi:hypothetical protein
MAILGQNKVDLAKWLEARRLERWLEIATENLEAPDKERVAREIEAHYAEAVTAHIAAGEPDLSAQDAALEELGEPKAAAANFQKSYLTGCEAKWMHSWETIAAKPLFSSAMLWWDIMPFAALAFLYPHPQWIIDFRLLATVVLVAYSIFRLIPRLLCARILPRIYFRRTLALWSSMPLVMLGLGFTLLTYQHRDTLGILMAAYIFFYYRYQMNPGFRIWNKLRKMGDGRTDRLPWQTTAS